MGFGVLHRMADGTLHPVTVLVVGHFHLVVMLKSARIQRHRIMLYCAIFRIIVLGPAELCFPSVHCTDGFLAKLISGFCVQTHLKGVPFARPEGAGDRLAAYTIAFDPVDLGVTNVCSVVQNSNGLVRHFAIFGGVYTEIHLLDSGNGQHLQTEFAGRFATAVVGIGHFGCAIVHRQNAAVYRAALPVGGLAHVKPGEGAQVKGAGGFFNIDVDFVVVARQKSQICVLAHVQTGQLVVVAIQIQQRQILAHIQFRQLVVVAVQIPQCWILAHIQTGQPVVAAIQILQCWVLAHIQFCQLIVVAIQILQCCVLAHIQTGQLVVVTNQLLQVGKELNALQAGNIFVVDIDLSDCVPLFL